MHAHELARIQPILDARDRAAQRIVTPIDAQIDVVARCLQPLDVGSNLEIDPVVIDRRRPRIRRLGRPKATAALCAT